MDLTQLKKYKEIERRPCPFYGFNGVAINKNNGMLLDANGNQCPLINGFSPCRMEIHKQEPNWKQCEFYRKDLLEKANKKKLKVFPSEFWPPENSSWAGVAFEDWFDYVMKS